jgi:hypothetical protein
MKALPTLSALLSVSLLSLIGCGKPEPFSPTPSSSPAMPALSSEEVDLGALAEREENAVSTSSTSRKEPSPEALNRALAWGLQKKAWSDLVRGIVRARRLSFEKARDKETFCPGYARASRAEQENCFVALVAAIVKLESNFRPAAVFREPNGTDSVGLLMLSPGECRNARTLAALKDPVQNLICGTNRMALLIERHGYISGPPNKRGAAAYWSTLRPPYTYGRYKLGKKQQIRALTRHYKGTVAGSGR